MTREAWGAAMEFAGWVGLAAWCSMWALITLWFIVKGILERRRDRLGLEECPRCGEFHHALEYHLRRCRGRPKSLLTEKRWRSGRSD
jgi:hypothetical protein